MTRHVAVAAADVGSLAGKNFGWYLSIGGEARHGHRPEALVDAVDDVLAMGHSVALGFECPLWLPMPVEAHRLGKARPGEGSRPWSAGAGSGALTTGVQQMAWVLSALAEHHGDTLLPTVDHDALLGGACRLLIWEAFVSGTGKSDPAGTDPHVEDARLAVVEFQRRVEAGTLASDCEPESEVFSLAGAALIRSGLTRDLALLYQAPVVVKVT